MHLRSALAIFLVTLTAPRLAFGARDAASPNAKHAEHRMARTEIKEHIDLLQTIQKTLKT